MNASRIINLIINMNVNMNMNMKMKEYRMTALKGFTLTELLVASTVMLVLIMGSLALFVRSNKVSVDQQQYSELQHNVRSALYFLTRDIRSAGVGVSMQLTGYCIEGVDGFGQEPEASDSLKLSGNYEEPLTLRVEKYTGSTAHLYEGELQNGIYPCPSFYENKEYLIISTQCADCYAYLWAASGSVHGCVSGAETINFGHGQSGVTPPGKLKDTGCASDCWDDSLLITVQIKFYWLDTTGNPSDYPGLNLTVGQRGYLGIPNTLYMTTIGHQGAGVCFPLAQDIENLQFEYNGDLDDDGSLDGFQAWDNNNWTILESDDKATREAKAELIGRIRQVRVWALGKTPQPFVSVSAQAPEDLHLYRRPAISNSPADTQDDRHRRFLLESTVAIRNMSLNVYNEGTR